MLNLNKSIEALREAGLFLATRRWYAAHLKACESQGIEPDSFEVCANEVLNTPKEQRAWLLESDAAVPNYEPHVHYAQYTSPRQEDMVTGLFYRDYRKEKK